MPMMANMAKRPLANLAVSTTGEDVGDIPSKRNGFNESSLNV